jgi:hypothetical protein
MKCERVNASQVKSQSMCTTLHPCVLHCKHVYYIASMCTTLHPCVLHCKHVYYIASMCTTLQACVLHCKHVYYIASMCTHCIHVYSLHPCVLLCIHVYYIANTWMLHRLRRKLKRVLRTQAEGDLFLPLWIMKRKRSKKKHVRQAHLPRDKPGENEKS